MFPPDGRTDQETLSAMGRRPACCALAIVGLDLLISSAWRMQVPVDLSESRLVLALLAWMLVSEAGSGSSLTGLRPPWQGWEAWARLGLYWGVFLLAALGAFGLAARRFGWPLPDPSRFAVAPPHVPARFISMCLAAPVLEETLYRMLLCGALGAFCGPRSQILVSGGAFALLHAAYGNPSPENQLGGFLLAWAYLRSGSLYVPLALHAVGNLFALFSHVGAWFYLQRVGFSLGGI